MSQMTVISLFTGAMGLDLGFDQEGFDIRVAVEKYSQAANTIRQNRPHIPVISKDIGAVSSQEILKTARLQVGEATVLTGAPPCEPFSTAGRRNGLQDHRYDAILDFIRVVKETKPRFFVFEEVPGFTRAAKRHISFYDRVSKRAEELAPDEELGSGFRQVMSALEGTGYTLSYDPEHPGDSILNAADFGTPQVRKRFILIGSREGPAVSLPCITSKQWTTLREGLKGLNDPVPECLEFRPSLRRYLKDVPAGGCWRALSKELQKEALGGAYDDPDNPRTKGKKGGRTGFLRRLSWEKPSPTLVDDPTGRATCLCHPDDLRPLSVKEYARVQGFPDDWLLCGEPSAKYRLIGQATPVALARAIASTIAREGQS